MSSTDRTYGAPLSRTAERRQIAGGEHGHRHGGTTEDPEQAVHWVDGGRIGEGTVAFASQLVTDRSENG